MKKKFKADRDDFEDSEILVYRHSAISHYDAMAGYFFEDSTGTIKSWDLEDTQSTGIWTEFFEMLKP